MAQTSTHRETEKLKQKQIYTDEANEKQPKVIN